MESLLQAAWQEFSQVSALEITGVLFGLLAVYWLIKENILTWPAGILYCIISIYLFWNANLYQDFGLTIFFLFMNVYGWYAWLHPSQNNQDELLITKTSLRTWIAIVTFCLIWIFGTGFLFSNFVPNASLPYPDATTTGLSIAAMWMTARKKLENWYLWFIVNIMSTVVYFIKDLNFYSILYFVYIGLAIVGYYKWLKSYKTQKA